MQNFQPKRVSKKEVVSLAALLLGALLACGSGMTPFMELPQAQQDMYGACSDEVNDWCLDEKFGRPPVRNDVSAEENVAIFEERQRVTDEHIDECVGSFGEDGLARQEYLKQGSAEKRKEWLLKIGCSEQKIASAGNAEKQ